MDNDKLKQVSSDLDKAANAMLGCGCLIMIVMAGFLLLVAMVVGL